MAELLIKAIDAEHSDPGKNVIGCYKRGDIIAVRPDGFEWGSEERRAPANGGRAVIVKIPGVTPAQIRNFIRNRWATEVDGEDVDEGLGRLRRRRICIDMADLPAQVRQTLNQTGEYSTTWAAIRQFVRNKQNNQTATGATL
jgi:hypothetical protein